MEPKTDVTSLLAEMGMEVDKSAQMPVNETVCEIKANQLPDFVQKLMKNGMWHLSAITAVEAETGFTLLYHFWLYGGLTLRVAVPKDRMHIASLTSTIPGAAFYEREIQELFGIQFEGLIHKEMLFIAEDWQDDPPMQSKEQNKQQESGVENERSDKS